MQLAKDDDDEAKVAALEFFFPKGTPVYVKVSGDGDEFEAETVNRGEVHTCRMHSRSRTVHGL